MALLVFLALWVLNTFIGTIVPTNNSIFFILVVKIFKHKGAPEIRREN